MDLPGSLKTARFFRMSSKAVGPQETSLDDDARSGFFWYFPSQLR
jgi:hypothetical protein